MNKAEAARLAKDIASNMIHQSISNADSIGGWQGIELSPADEQRVHEALDEIADRLEEGGARRRVLQEQPPRSRMIWRSPSGGIHIYQDCSGNYCPTETKRSIIGMPAFMVELAAGKVCRCAQHLFD
jgi:hypothetical protein